MYLRHLSPDIRCLFYYGQGTIAEAKDLATYDIVCTTYETVFRDSIRSATLQAVNWSRIVLDEGTYCRKQTRDSLTNWYGLAQAHHIRNRTKAFQAVMNLRTEKKWCLTGTPVSILSEQRFLDVDLSTSRESCSESGRILETPLDCLIGRTFALRKKC